MGMSAGGSGGVKGAPVINMTPLIDVLLVLLIIFMVISPIVTLWVFRRDGRQR